MKFKIELEFEGKSDAEFILFSYGLLHDSELGVDLANGGLIEALSITTFWLDRIWAKFGDDREDTSKLFSELDRLLVEYINLRATEDSETIEAIKALINKGPE